MKYGYLAGKKNSSCSVQKENCNISESVSLGRGVSFGARAVRKANLQGSVWISSSVSPLDIHFVYRSLACVFADGAFYLSCSVSGRYTSVRLCSLVRLARSTRNVAPV